MPHEAPVDGVQAILTDSARALAASPELPPEIWNLLTSLNTIINASIGLLISLTIIFLFISLLRWALWGTESHTGRSAAESATRAVIALFIMVDIWFIIRFIRLLEDISPIVAYAIFIISFLTLGFWSIFGIGRALLDAISWTVNSGVEFIVRFLKTEKVLILPVFRILAGWSDVALRFSILSFVAVLGALALSIPFTFPASEDGNRVAILSPGPVYAENLVFKEGDTILEGNRFESLRYGISIEYPEGWTVLQVSPENYDGLAEARSGNLAIQSRLNAGLYADLATSSREAYLTALWRVEKNIHSAFSADSAGILYAFTEERGEIDGTMATVLQFISYWPTEDGSIRSFYDFYYMFGDGPVFYTLAFRIEGEDYENDETIPGVIEQIIETIRVSEPQLDR